MFAIKVYRQYLLPEYLSVDGSLGHFGSAIGAEQFASVDEAEAFLMSRKASLRAIAGFRGAIVVSLPDGEAIYSRKGFLEC